MINSTNKNQKFSLKATRTVYCYYFPEIREIIDKITKKFPHEIFLQSIEPGLDNFHTPVINKFIEYHKSQTPDLKDFENRYYTSGASEGIFHILVKIKTENPRAIIYVLKGEYEGYREYGSRIGLKIVAVEKNQDFSKLEPGIFFISNPSARDGNIIPNYVINEICKIHKVVFDGTYIGLTKNNLFDLKNKNILAVIFSMSKPFGLYYYRIGFVFSREKIKTLEANIWFKNILSLIIADNILDTIKPQYLYNKYKPLQKEIIAEINKRENLNLKPSDAILLAYSDKAESLEKFKREDFYRLCLTPYFLLREKQNAR